jgi:hypothetical protein
MDWLIRVGWKKAIISFGVLNPSGARWPEPPFNKSSALSIGNRACLRFPTLSVFVRLEGWELKGEVPFCRQY